MKLEIEKGQLVRGLGRLQAIVEKRSTMPILANVLITAIQDKKNKGGLELAATDLEIGIRGVLPATITESGSLTVSARKLFDIAKELPEQPVQITTSDSYTLNITCGRSKFSLAGTDATEYPEIAEIKPADLATLPAPVLAEMIDKTIYAASTDESRYNLNGVYLEVDKKEGKIRMVATDGHRLALIEREGLELANKLDKGVIIPRKGLAELKRLLDEGNTTELKIGFEGSSVLVKSEEVSLVMRLIEGEFPNYSQVLPKQIGSTIIVPTQEAIRALRRVALLSAERSRAIKVVLSEGLLTITATNPDLGEAQEELDINYDGETIEIGFNATYVLDALNTTGAKEARLCISEANAPAEIGASEPDGSRAVVMPMRL